MATRETSERAKNASSRKCGFAREQARRSAAQIGKMLDAVNTCATMLLQFGVSVWGVAGMRGTTEDVIRRTNRRRNQDYLSRRHPARMIA
jgi:hypothetical protein